MDAPGRPPPRPIPMRERAAMVFVAVDAEGDRRVPTDFDGLRVVRFTAHETRRAERENRSARPDRTRR
jgi:hypothetical protein